MDVQKNTHSSSSVTSAVASVQAEGFVVDQQTIDRLQAFANGDITASQAREQALQSAHELASGS
jgi:hypothetical protein